MEKSQPDPAIHGVSTHVGRRRLLQQSTNRCDFALVTMLGLLIFEATGSDIEDLGEEHGHRVLRVHGKGDISRSQR
jgi:hypothetical protein